MNLCKKEIEGTGDPNQKLSFIEHDKKMDKIIFARPEKR